MMRSVSFLERSERRGRSATRPVVRADTSISARIVWASCALALGGAGLVAWFGQEPARDAVVLSPQSQFLPQGVSGPSMAQFPGLVSPPSGPTVAPLLAATITPLSPPAAQAAESDRTRAESAAVTAGASSVPVSTWVVVTRAPGEVPPRSDMRYQANTPPSR